MSEAEAKVERIKELLGSIERGIAVCRQILRGEKVE